MTKEQTEHVEEIGTANSDCGLPLTPDTASEALPVEIDEEFEGIINHDLRSYLPDATPTPKSETWLHEQKQMCQQRRETLKGWLQRKGRPNLVFSACRLDGKLVLIDPRIDQFLVAKELGLPYEVQVHPYTCREEARQHLIEVLQMDHCNNSEGQRILQCLLLLPTWREKARKNQGQRHDLLPDSEKCFKPVNVTAELAALAGVGKTKFSHIKRLWEDIAKPDNERILDKQRATDLIGRILRDEASIFYAYKVFKNARKKKNQTDQFAKANLERQGIQLPEPEKEAQNLDIATDAPVKLDDPVESEASFQNPDLQKGYENQIACGDYEVILPRIPNQVAELVIVSPEYNLPSVNYNGRTYSTAYSDYLDKLDRLWTLCADKLVLGGRLAIVIASVTHTHAEDLAREFNTKIFSDIPHRIERLDIGLKFRTHIIWNKRFGFHSRNASGATAGPRNPFIQQDHEFILVFSNRQYELEPTVKDAPVDITNDESNRWRSSVWDIVPPSYDDHPASFGSEIPKRLIQLLSFPGGLTIDPCNGVGNSSAAAAILGRRWFGCDIDEKYCRIARKKTEEAYQKYLKRVATPVTDSDPDDSESTEPVTTESRPEAA